MPTDDTNSQIPPVNAETPKISELENELNAMETNSPKISPETAVKEAPLENTPQPTSPAESPPVEQPVMANQTTDTNDNLAAPNLEQQPQGQEIPPSGVGKKSGVVFWIAVVLFALSMLALVAYFVGAYQQGRVSFGNKSTPTPIATVSPTVRPATPTPDPTADWEIFTFKDFGFSIKYPKSVFSYKEDLESGLFIASSSPQGGNGIKFLGNSDLWLSVGAVGSTKATLDEYIKSKSEYLNAQTTKYSFNGIDGYKLSYIFMVGPAEPFKPTYLLAGLLINNGSVISFELGSWNEEVLKENEKLFDQILSTFKLLTPITSPSPTATSSASPASGFGM